MSAASMKLYTQAVEAGKGDLDFSAVAQLFLKWLEYYATIHSGDEGTSVSTHTGEAVIEVGDTYIWSCSCPCQRTALVQQQYSNSDDAELLLHALKRMFTSISILGAHSSIIALARIQHSRKYRILRSRVNQTRWTPTKLAITLSIFIILYMDCLVNH